MSLALLVVAGLLSVSEAGTVITALPPMEQVPLVRPTPVTACPEPEAQRKGSEGPGEQPFEDQSDNGMSVPFILHACVSNTTEHRTRVELETGTVLIDANEPGHWQAIVVLQGISQVVRPGEAFEVDLWGLCVEPLRRAPFGRQVVPVGRITTAAVRAYEAAWRRDGGARYVPSEQTRLDLIAGYEEAVQRWGSRTGAATKPDDNER